jgi:diaminohydroxyphosphoribosylaminopyrimidine deaminase/5-amino-6-(5-phosphoribosylamino)uracil reductase
MTDWSPADRTWMRRALRLAALGLGATAPNPSVGCVLVQGGRLIGQGRHRRCGGVHAEVAALADAHARGADPRGATAYVTLAPCTRHGRQPPCVESLVTAGVARVVAALADPHQDDPAARLTGIAYAVGCEAAAATQVHGGFLSRVRRGRPRITGKWAMTLDGCLAATAGDSRWISTPGALALARRRRRAFDAIVIGGGTAAADDPQLLALGARPHLDGAGPRRVVLGHDPAIGAAARLLAPAAAPLHVVGGAALTRTRPWLRPHLVDQIDPHDPVAVTAWLGRLGCNEVLVEGGAQVHAAWLAAGLYDRLEIYLGPLVLGGGRPVAAAHGPDLMARAAAYQPEEPPRLVDGTTVLRLARRG